jgi:hypothetical protein
MLIFKSMSSLCKVFYLTYVLYILTIDYFYSELVLNLDMASGLRSMWASSRLGEGGPDPDLP